METECIIWQGYKDRNGYARSNGRVIHRVVYKEKVGELVPGLVIDHLCRNRACINPDHLEQVAQRENILRGIGFPAILARMTHCANGHAFDEGNTYRWKGLRHCRACNREIKRKAAAKAKELK